MNESRNKSPKQKKNFASNFLFFPGCETEVKYIYPKETKKKKLEKKPFIQPHQMPTKHAHAPNPSSLFQRNKQQKHSRRKCAGERPRRSEEREREEATDTGR